jgi:hypothetical protein
MARQSPAHGIATYGKLAMYNDIERDRTVIAANS